ncbi:uncharacterized protein LOC121736254 [Aricia agestis]|uniref:uncharacterized protein LOC121736254 n=1 Tax=Aricia agestis TaxID=91739 RepID=UPI001C2081DE|nr:uncharacterized protein LOC121736254 [Aricia agestis]
MENARVLRSGKSTPSREETPSSGQTTTHETNTWSRGTGVEDTTESSTRTDARAKPNSVPAQFDNVVENVGSAPGTIVNVPGDRASSKLSALQAELEYHNSELARARAASAAAMSRLEIARIELGESTDADQPPRSNKTRVEGWISEQCVRPSTSAQNPGRDPRPTENIEPRAGNTSLSDMTLLANAIVQAVNSSRSEATPKFIHELPHFDGTITEWMAFKSVFNDTADMFSDIQNVARLRKALRGAARETVRALLYTVSDPYEIIDTLERRYGRPELLILSEIENIKRLPRMTEDGRNVSSFASKISNTVAAIKSLNQPQYLYSPELVGRIVDKLNIILKYKWYEFKSERPGAPELELMARFLNIMADQCGAMFAYETAREERRGKMKPRAVNTTRTRTHRSTRYDSDSSCDRSDCEVTYEPRNTVAAAFKPSAKKAEPFRPKHRTPRPATETPRSATEAPSNSSNRNNCPVCSGSHTTINCADFIKLSVSERWDAAKNSKLCFRCLNNSHGRTFRCKYIPCGINGCEASHNKLLHGSGSAAPPASGNVSSINHVRASNTYLKVVPVEISGPVGTTATYALLDEGSTLTLVERTVADSVAPRGRSQLLKLEGVGGNQIDDPESCNISLTIRGACSRNLEKMNASTISNLNLTPQSVSKDLVRQCSHLAELEDELCYEQAKPTILIGQDNWHLITSRQLRIGNKGQPVASLTKLGWVLHGQDASSRNLNNIQFISHVRTSQSEDPALELIRNYFSIESLGIEPRKPKADPDERALTVLNRTCNKMNDCDRYESGLLWKTDNEVMPDNKKQALSRLYNLENKLDKNLNLKIEYSKQVNNLLSSGYAELVSTPATSPRTWYLPHFSVVHPQKGKVRLVFDAAAKCGGKCLNDALLTGPDLLQSLFGVLVRFREGKIAVVADIKEMFLQIKVIESDRDSLRFLWRGDDRNIPPREYRMTSLIFGAASSPCVAIHVKNKNAQNFSSEYPKVAKAAERNFYMDDYLDSFDDADEARQAVNAMYRINLGASFELRGWASNVPEVIKDVSDKRISGATTLGKSDTERTLGLIWNHARDTLGFNVNLRNTPSSVISGEILPTKRQVTSAVMSVFDPLGLVSPVTMVGKCLIQEIWRSGVGWDDPITKEHHITWMSFINNLNLLRTFEIERYVPAPPSGEGELHIFCDASEKVYSAAVYFVSMNNNTKTARLVTGKAKVAPLKPISIPRLELQAAVLGSRLAESVKRESDYKITKSYYWSDSKTVLAWIRSDPRTFKSFVAHRLAEIESTTTPADWRWVPSADNVADDATKGIPVNFSSTHRWFTGPSFILDDPATWPCEKRTAVPLPPSGEERIIKQVHVCVDHVNNDYLPKVERFSKYKRLVRAAATVLLSAEAFKAKLLKRKVNTEISPDHIRLAELLLIKRSQNISFADDIKTIEAGQRPPKRSPFHKLAVKLDRSGILYLDSRVKEEYNLPVLHAKEEFTRLLVHHTHAVFNHGNHQTVMNELRQRYHIIGLRSILRYICNKCQWCRTYRGTPSKIPLGDLPPERLAHNQPPFTALAVDYFGPMQVTIGRRHEKRWGALYTCLTTRAVHLELVPSLSASSMIMSLRRMMSRRGTPTVIYSDNGTNFVGAEKEVTEALQQNDDAMKVFASGKQIIWKRIPPGAPNMGGAWERLVRSVKAALRVTLTEKTPPDEVLHTLLLEAEHVINTRPLTPVNPDLNEESLTPNHFLIGRSSGMIPFGSYKDYTADSRSWKAAQKLAEAFWARWVAEYKPQLMPRLGNPQHSNLNPGDIVIICDRTMPRGIWPRGEIIKTFPGPDGRVRVAEVRTAAGLIRRPASRLILVSSQE